MIDLLRAVLERLVEDDLQGAAQRIARISVDALLDARNLRIREVAKAVRLHEAQRMRTPRGSVSMRQKRAVFAADGYRCRLCGRHTVDVEVLRGISTLLPTQFRYHPHWKFEECHIVYWTHSTSLDHMIPLARSGQHDVLNFITSCYECNDIRSDFRLEEVGWSLKERTVGAWDGMREFLPRLKTLARVRGTTVPGLPPHP